MDGRTKKLLDDYHRWQEGGEGNAFSDLAREWLLELEAQRIVEEADFERFVAGLSTAVLRCQSRHQGLGFTWPPVCPYGKGMASQAPEPGYLTEDAPAAPSPDDLLLNKTATLHVKYTDERGKLYEGDITNNILTIAQKVSVDLARATFLCLRGV